MANEISISGNSYLGIIGCIKENEYSISIMSMSNLSGLSSAGLIGGIDTCVLLLQGLGTIVFLDSTPEATVGEILNSATINGINFDNGDVPSAVVGCLVNECSDDDLTNREVFNITTLS